MGWKQIDKSPKKVRCNAYSFSILEENGYDEDRIICTLYKTVLFYFIKLLIIYLKKKFKLRQRITQNVDRVL